MLYKGGGGNAVGKGLLPLDLYASLTGLKYGNSSAASIDM